MPRSIFSSSLSGLFLATAAVACSATIAEGPAGGATTAAAECTAAETRCSGLQVQTCEADQGAPRWSAPAACADGEVCREGTGCTALTATEQQRVRALGALLTESRDVGARAKPVDYAALEATLRGELLAGDGTPKAYVRTMWKALLAVPQGHQFLGPASLETSADARAAEALGFTLGPSTRYGTCLRPFGDHAVVTTAPPGNALRKGDEIVAIDGKRGAEMTALLVSEPNAGGYIPPTEAGRVFAALRAFFSRGREGTKLTVVRPGTPGESEVTLPAPGPEESTYSCEDAFNRDMRKPALGTVLPDGTGVLFLSGFEQRTIADFESEVGPEFDKVKSAPRLVLDLRGNRGGSLNAALHLAAQLPEAKKTETCEFFDRTAGTDPPAYESRGKRLVDPTAIAQPARFAYAGRVALLVDGGTVSSGEHFVLAARKAARVIVVGTKTAGAYGNTSRDEPKALAADPKLEVIVNRSQVRDLQGAPLDGVSQEPDVVVDYEPAALAAGKDPMLLRAVSELSK